MQIANPLYDTVFKYLLEDEPVASLFISALLGREIVELYYNPQEILRTPDTDKQQVRYDEGSEKLTFFSVLRLDFSAKVRDATGGFQTILIEIQKANNGSDLMRFRKYLGAQYANKNNTIRNEKGILNPIPLYPIYFLGEGLERIKGHGAVKIARVARDIFTDEIIDIKDDFIENLSHDALIVCANELQGDSKTGLSKLLSIFNLASSLKYSHFLTIDENDYPEEYRPIIRRLQKAAEAPEVRYQMDSEDDLSDYIISVERARDAERNAKVAAEQQVDTERTAKIAAEQQAKMAEQQVYTERTAKIAAEQQAKMAEQQAKMAEQQAQMAEQQVDTERTAKIVAEQQAKMLFQTLVKLGIEQGLSAAEIAAKFNLPLTDVEILLNSL
jgi:hypothetical protein